MSAQAGILETERTPQKGLVRRTGYFIANGAGAIPAANVVGRVLTVSHDATGNYTVTTDKPFKSLIGFGFMLGNIVRGDLTVIVDMANSNVNAGNFQIRCRNTSNTLTDIPAGGYCFLDICGSTWGGNTAA